jgi:hypothetical protein
MTRRMRRLVTVRYTNRPIPYLSELDWPLGELADVVSEPQPEPDAASSPSGLGLLDDGEAPGPLDSDYGHGWAA